MDNITHHLLDIKNPGELFSIYEYQKLVRDKIETLKVADDEVVFGIAESEDEYDIQNNIETLQKEMMEAAQNLQFERAAQLRDKIKELEERIK